MKRFIKKTLYFILTPMLAFLFLFIGVDKLNRKVSSNAFNYISAPSVFAGDSHIEQTINDSLTNKFVNIGQISESYYFTYYKLKLLFETNTSVNQVFLGFGCHSLSSYFNMFIDGKFSNTVSSKYFFILPMKEKIRIIICKRNEVVPFLKAILKTGFQNIASKKKTFQGGFTNEFISSIALNKSMQERIEFQYFENGTMNDFCESNIVYLYKIAELCRAKKIKLVFVNTPLHEQYKSMIPQKFTERYSQIIADLGIDLLDMSNLLKEDDYFFSDGEHVSLKGARTTTEWIVNNL
jgi:hypothetical protein